MAVRCLYTPCGEIVTDEQFIDDELYLLGIQVDMSAPPTFEFQIAISFGIDVRVDVVLLGPERIRWIHVLEILDEPRAVELSAAEIAGKRGQPASTQQPA